MKNVTELLLKACDPSSSGRLSEARRHRLANYPGFFFVQVPGIWETVTGSSATVRMLCLAYHDTQRAAVSYGALLPSVRRLRSHPALISPTHEVGLTTVTTILPTV
ncbi:hypothetical protein ACN47E_008223 [Coniothyrium glycines]